MNDEKKLSVIDRIEIIKARICDELCKYPEQCKDENELQEKCKECLPGEL